MALKTSSACVRGFFFILHVKFVVACLFLFRGVGGSDRWFGTSVEDTVELPRSQGSLPVKPEALKNSRCRFLSSDKRCTAEVFFLSPGNAHQLTSQHIVLCPTTDRGQHRFHEMRELSVPCFVFFLSISVYSAYVLLLLSQIEY